MAFFQQLTTSVEKFLIAFSTGLIFAYLCVVIWKKRILVLVLAVVVAMAVTVPESAGQHTFYRIEDGIPMFFEVDEKGDTLYIDAIEPAWVFPKGSKRARNADWRRYYKLVYNFNQVYPYALLGRRLVEEADSTIAACNLKNAEKAAYINNIQKGLLRDFGSIVRRMTISQGLLLVRLVDRECGKTSYSIIKGYKSGFSAAFWQGIARLFGQNLKSAYDPEGKDKQTEELVKKWEDGSFAALYYSIFMELPPSSPMPEKYR